MPFSEAEIIADPGYPGWHSGMAVGPRMHTVARPIGPELKDSFWILEYRWSYGIRPLGFTVVDDAMNWGLQRGAYETHLPGSNGQDYALAGVHAYCRELPQFSALEDEAREQRLDGGEFPSRSCSEIRSRLVQSHLLCRLECFGFTLASCELLVEPRHQAGGCFISDEP